MRFEVGVVGGGVIGLACAWRLAQAGARVALYEQNLVGRGASHAAGGMLAAQCEAAGHPPRGSSTEPDQTFLGAYLQSRSLYPDFARELLEVSGLDIELSQQGAPTEDWREPGILFHADHKNPEQKAQVLEAFEQQKASGLGVEERSCDKSAAFWLADEGQVENRLLARALRLACEGQGVQIFENAAVRHDQGAWKLNGEPLNAEQVLLCGGAWSGLLWAGLTRPLAGQMLVLDAGRSVGHIHYGSRAYLIPRRDGRLLLGATEEERGFSSRSTAAGAQALLSAALEMLPELGECSITDHWAGLRPASPDGLPSIGRLDERSWCATGHGRNGILLCPWTAQIIADAMLRGTQVPSAFDPARLSL